MGERLRARLSPFADHPLAGEVRGAGLIIRIVGDSICLCPPLIVTAAEVDAIVDRFAAVLEETAARVAAGLP